MSNTFSYDKHLLVAYRFDEPNPRDLSGNSFNATGVGIDSTNLVRGPRDGDWGIALNGSNERIDISSTITARTFVIHFRPSTTSEQIIQFGGGEYITISSGTVTFTGVTATAYYVNSVLSGTVKAIDIILVVVLNTDIEADDISFGFDGTNYGALNIFMSAIFSRALTYTQVQHLTNRIRQGRFL